MKKENLPPVGTKVFDFQYGWGVISSIAEGEFYSVYSCFENKGNHVGYAYTSKGKSENGNVPTLSLTEYDLVNGGFTPISEWNKPKIGDVGYFWDDENWENLFYSVFTQIGISENYPYESLSGGIFKNFSQEVPEWYKDKIEEVRKGLKK